MKIKVFKVRIWTFIRRKRMRGISFMANLFGRKPRGQLASEFEVSLVREASVDEEFEAKADGAVAFPERKKRPMHVITMWNPASATSVVAPIESSPKVWLRQASKKWKEHGSGRRLLDPIEDGPETSQDWRTRFLDIDPERRWPVQGW